MKNIKRFNENMEYRRFGKTNETLSVITLGGMRYFDGWAEPRDYLPVKMIDQCADITKRSLDAGINHIETAFGYGKSEHCYGLVLNEILKYPRDSYYLMTKGRAQTRDDMRKQVESQLKALRTDHVDFYAWHGINIESEYEWAIKNGTVEELLKMKEEGLIKHVGFSTHGMRDIVYRAIQTDLFEFANIHYYYFNRQHQKSVDLMVKKDMGLFIISPNDKGGQLFNPSQKIKEITKPITPIQWHTNYCLRNPNVHTLTFGLTEVSHVEEMQGIFQKMEKKTEKIDAITAEMDKQVPELHKNFDAYQFTEKSSPININNIYRMWCQWKFYGMSDFLKYRYNMFNGSSFIWGEYPDEEKIKNIDYTGITIPEGIDIPAIIREVHANFYDEEKHKPKK